jgi:predicted nucleotidyltransferase
MQALISLLYFPFRCRLVFDDQERPSLSLMYDLKESLKKLFGCEVDLVRFRDSLRPMLKNNILNEAIYV